MKKPLMLAGLSLFVLIGAAYPEAPRLHYAAAVMAAGADVSGPTYRPCRRDRRDDRCIQLYERGVRAAYAEWLRDHGMGGPEMRVADPGDRPRARRHRRERYAVADVRCVETRAHPGGEAHGHRGRPERMEFHHRRDERMDHREREERNDYEGGRDGDVRGM